MPDTPRLRPHPEERLASPVQLVDLTAAAAELRHEPHAAVAGHRQIAVFRSGPVTLLAFAFEADGILKEHQTDGVVTIHALSGHLRIIVDEEAFELTAGRLLALAPHTRHTVLALAPSDMLLTVHKSTL